MGDLFEAIRFLISAPWGFFEITVPGMSISFGMLFLGLFLAGLGLRFVLAMVGASVSGRDMLTVAKERDSN